MPKIEATDKRLMVSGNGAMPFSVILSCLYVLMRNEDNRYRRPGTPLKDIPIGRWEVDGWIIEVVEGDYDVKIPKTSHEGALMLMRAIEIIKNMAIHSGNDNSPVDLVLSLGREFGLNTKVRRLEGGV